MRSVPALMVSFAAALAVDWPEWRGPQRDGTVTGWAAPSIWPDTLKKKWRVDVGEGHSSPIVSGNRIFVFTRTGEQETVRALDLNGRNVWQQSYAAPYEMNSAARSHGKGPKSTPVASGGRLYTVGIGGILSCWDASTGKLHWRKEFSKFGSTSPLYGTAMSPAVHNGVLLAHVGGHDSGAFTAFDAATGQVKWQWTGDGPGYSSAAVGTFDGVRQVITHTQNNFVGLSFENGRLLWSVPFRSPYDQNSVTPLVHGEMVIYTGLSHPAVAVKPLQNHARKQVASSAPIWTLEKVWENPGASLYMNSFVRSGDLLFGMTNRNSGQFICVDAKTGKTLWTSEPRQGENAAMLRAGDLVLALSTDAVLTVFRAQPQAYQVVRKYTVADSPTWAHPLLVNGGILVKDKTSLALWSF